MRPLRFYTVMKAKRCKVFVPETLERKGPVSACEQLRCVTTMFSRYVQTQIFDLVLV